MYIRHYAVIFQWRCPKPPRGGRRKVLSHYNVILHLCQDSHRPMLSVYDVAPPLTCSQTPQQSAGNPRGNHGLDP